MKESDFTLKKTYLNDSGVLCIVDERPMKQDSKKTFVIEGSRVKSMDEFYDEVQRVLCPRFKGFGRSWNAFRDILRGGFLEFDLDEPINIIILDSKKMSKHLPESQYSRFIKYLDDASHVSYELR